MRQKFLAQSEVCEYNMTFRIQKNIFQFNISVNNSQLQIEELKNLINFRNLRKASRHYVAFVVKEICFPSSISFSLLWLRDQFRFLFCGCVSFLGSPFQIFRAVNSVTEEARYVNNSNSLN